MKKIIVLGMALAIMFIGRRMFFEYEEHDRGEGHER
jgi:hypothetical protein